MVRLIAMATPDYFLSERTEVSIGLVYEVSLSGFCACLDVRARYSKIEGV